MERSVQRWSIYHQDNVASLYKLYQSTYLEALQSKFQNNQKYILMSIFSTEKSLFLNDYIYVQIIFSLRCINNKYLIQVKHWKLEFDQHFLIPCYDTDIVVFASEEYNSHVNLWPPVAIKLQSGICDYLIAFAKHYCIQTQSNLMLI